MPRAFTGSGSFMCGCVFVTHMCVFVRKGLVFKIRLIYTMEVVVLKVL